MKPVTFSKNTLSILKNFSSLNSNLLIKPGDVIKTITPSKNGMAIAKVDEKFDVEFGIWDLNKFLGVISLFSTPTFDFGQKEVTGKFGINIHKAGENSNEVNNWSAGCQVFKKSKDFAEFMELVKKQKNLYGNTFTYTLIDKRAVEKKKVE